MNAAFQAMYNLLQSDTRYRFEAYQFVRESLAYAHEHLKMTESAGRQKPIELVAESMPRPSTLPAGQHITGQQLCEACRLYALQQYGYLAGMVLNTWGIRSTSDLGEIVYNLIRIEQMRKSESDRREDFDNVFSFDNAFEPQFDVVAPEKTV